MSVSALVDEGAKLRPSRSSDPVTAATKASIASLAHRIQSLEREIAELDATLAPLLSATAPELLALDGLDPTARPPSWSLLATTPNDCAQRRRGPICAGWHRSPRHLGKSTGRYRLNTGGNRQANSALWHIVITRLAWDPDTKAYFERRTKEGRTKREVIRSLKRYVARGAHREPASRLGFLAVGPAHARTVTQWVDRKKTRRPAAKGVTISKTCGLIRACPRFEWLMIVLPAVFHPELLKQA